VLYVPWATTQIIARAAALCYPHKLLAMIEAEERELNEEAMYGTVITDWDGVDHHLSPEDVRQRFENHRKPYLDALRAHVGEERARELLERRDLLLRLGQAASVAQRALDVLAPTQKSIVANLRKDLEAAIDGVDFLPPSGPVS
jgi:hypothetical protein